MEFEVQLKGINELAARFDGAKAVIEEELTRSTTRLVLQGEAHSKRVVRKKTRTLMRSITHRVTTIAGGVRGVWGTRLFYGPYIEKGTGPHVIVARSAKALYWPGARHPVRKVKHPGGKAYPFILPAFQLVKSKAPAEYLSALRRIITRLRG